MFQLGKTIVSEDLIEKDFPYCKTFFKRRRYCCYWSTRNLDY